MSTSTNFVHPLNLRLYKNELSPAVSTSSYRQTTKIEVYNTEGKIELISAYNFHPDKTNWWKSILYTIMEFIWGKKAILVSVHNEPPLFICV